MTGRARRAGALGPRLAALFVIGLGVITLVDALSLGQRGGYVVIGPVFLPMIIGGVLVFLGVVFLLRSTVLPDASTLERSADEDRATHWPTVGLLIGLLVAYSLALNGFNVAGVRLPGLGYIVATGLFLPAGARALGSRHIVRDVVAGFGLAIIVYFGFTQYLGVRLPAGILDPLL